MASTSSSAAHWVAGVDGCRTGWVVVLRDLTAGIYLARVVPDFHAVLALREAPQVIAVDVPIGLLATAIGGGRACEVLARQLIRDRRSSVFSAPTRAALTAFRTGSDYRSVSTANRGGIETAPGLSQQSFAILPKIAEVDAALSATAQRVVREVHPELCFAEANAGTPMRYSKKKLAGRTERVTLLSRLGFPSSVQLLGSKLPVGTKVDDVLDACIACWTAERIATGSAIVTPTNPPIDSRGLRMELWR